MKSPCFILLNALFTTNPVFAQVIDASTVEALVKNAPCLDNQSIDAVLTNKIKTGSQRDLGWQVFTEDDHFEVERAFLINKSMQLRFRWRVHADGSIAPVSKRAEGLCVSEST